MKYVNVNGTYCKVPNNSTVRDVVGVYFNKVGYPQEGMKHMIAAVRDGSVYKTISLEEPTEYRCDFIAIIDEPFKAEDVYAGPKEKKS